MPLEFRLPELGENIASGTITKVLVKAGDTIAVNQAVIEIETDKAVVEVPSNVAGTVKEVKAVVGKTISVGNVVFVLEAGAKAAAPAAAPPPTKKAEPAPKQVSAPPPRVAPASATAAGSPPLAPPSVRRLAHELGVDIDRIAGSGPGGRVSAEDVRAAAQQPPAAPQEAPVEATPATPAIATDRDRWGAIERQPMSAIRRKTAVHLTNAWQAIPHVTHFDQADITAIEAFRKKYAPRIEAKGGRLTVTALLLKVLATALRKFPRFNTSVDMEGQSIVFKKYVNIGVAVDTENGLLVPVVRDADTKSILDLCVEIPLLAEKARTRKLSLDDMSGGTFTVTNLGGIGGTAFTPIINAPEVAILGVSRSRVEPVFQNGAFAPRTMLPLSLSYDHRVIDGADAARFTRWVAEALEQPFVLLLEDMEA